MHHTNVFKRQPYPRVNTLQRSDLHRELYRLYGKRCFDIVFCILSAPIVVLVICLLACLVAATGQSPFFTQERVGKDGRVFKMWKLRTMHPHDPHSLRDYLAQNPKARDEWRQNQKLRHDPRVTTVGRFLRCTSLDELLRKPAAGDQWELAGFIPEQSKVFRARSFRHALLQRPVTV